MDTLLNRGIKWIMFALLVIAQYGGPLIGSLDMSNKAYAASTTVAYAGSSTNGVGSYPWTNPGNASGDTTSTSASVSLNGNQLSSYLMLTGFNLGGAGLVSGAIINGVTVEVEWQTSTATIVDTGVNLIIGGVVTGSNLATLGSQTVKGFKTYGGSSNKWGLSLTAAQLLSSNFGVAFQVKSDTGGSKTANVFRVRVTVDYTSDITAPIIIINDNVATGPVQSDTINVSVSESNPNIVTYQYAFSTDITCNSSDFVGGESTYVSGSNFSIITQTNNGRYLCFKAADLAGNTSYLGSTNPLNIDVTVPVVTLSGSSTINIVQGSSYVDAGASWTDNADGSGSTYSGSYGSVNTFAVSGSVNTGVVGTYIIQYLKVDRAGNMSSVASRTVNVSSVSSTPTDIILDPSSIIENSATGSLVGELTPVDPISMTDLYTYGLVSGTGDTNNSSFSISGNKLLIQTRPNYEFQSGYSIRVRVTDDEGLSYEKIIVVSVMDVLDYNPSDILITEVMYNPAGSENAAEWFELYNPTSGTISLSGWKVQEQPTTGGVNSYTFGSGVILAPGQTLLVVNDTAAFNADFTGIVPNVDMSGSGCVSATECLQLNNSSSSTKVDHLRLLDLYGVEIDYTSWGDYGNAGNGQSLCRKNLTDTSTSGDWQICTISTPGVVSFNVAPVANNNTGSTIQGGTGIVYVLANDIDVNGDVLSITGLSVVSGLQASVLGTGVLFTGSVGFCGTGLFTYQAWDGLTGSNVATGMISITCTYTLDYSTTTGGTITGNLTQIGIVAGGTGTSVTAVPSTGYVFSGWSDGFTGATRIDGSLTGSRTVTAQFTLNTYTLQYNSSTGGALSGTTTQNVNHGATGTAILAVASIGYSFSGWSDGSIINPRIDGSITTGKVLTAYFVDNSIPIITVIGATGLILNVGDTYTESGAIWTDNGLTGSALISGTVNTGSTGVYLLTYYHIDSSGNMGTGLRTVTIISPICTPGSQLNGSGTACQPCDIGTYNPTTGGVCMYSNPGSFVGTTGATGQELCGLGYYSSMTGQNACMPAAPGSYIAVSGATGSVVCPVGTYNNLPGQNACTATSVGYYTRQTGSTGEIACPQGSYNPLTGQSACIPAPLGSYVSGTGASASVQCSAGSFSDMLGSMSCIPCGLGYNSATGAVNCMDVGLPVVNLIGSGTVIVAHGSSYTDSGASWTDNADGSGSSLTGTWGSTGSFAVSGTVNMSQTGTYYLYYKKVDLSGNSGEVMRTVIVTDQMAPQVVTIGSGAITILLNSVYVDSGASWTDAVDGSGIVMASSGIVNTGVVGIYLLEYMYVDAAGNTGNTAGRYVTVSSGAAPTIIVNGSTGITQQAWLPYVELGAMYDDLEDGTGNIGLISGVVNTGVLGTYIITYDYTDTHENSAKQQLRTITIIAPTCTPGSELSISGSVPSCLPCDMGSYNSTTGGVCTGAGTGYYVGTTGATMQFACAPGFYSSMTGQYACTPAAPGRYVSSTGASEATPCPIGYYTDILGQVSCTAAPAGSYIAYTSSTGSSACIPGSYQSLTGQMSCVVADPGSYVSGTGSSVQQMCPANTFSDVLGSTSCIPCASGYTSSTGSMVCADTQGPVIILSGLTGLVLEASTGVHIDSGASWTDNADGSGSNLTGTRGATGSFAVSGTVNLSQTGTYYVEYRKVDLAGNSTGVVRVVIVQDTTPPSVVLNGSGTIYLNQGTTGGYAESGASWTDNLDGSGTIIYATSGLFDLYTSGTYLLEYLYTDRSGNIGSTMRTLIVRDILPPTLTLLGGSGVIINVGSGFSDPGASWTDLAAGSGVVLTPISGVVNAGLAGIYILTYRYTDPAGNMSNAVMRTVTVVNPTLIDTDRDGNTDTIENAGNNGGDGNGDGIIDSAQTNVAGAPNPLTSSYTTLETTGGCMIVSDFNIITEPSLSAQDALYSYPLGLNKFEIRCSDPGMTGVVTVYYDRVYDTSQWLWRKFASGSNTYTDIGPVVAVSIGSKRLGGTPVTKVTFSIRDGGLADEDGLANAVIIDPSGPAIPVIVSPIISSPSGGGGYVSSPLPIPTNNTSPGSETTGIIIIPKSTDIFNPSITDGYCYSVRTGTNIIDSLLITTDSEFKPSLAFLYAHELTKFNSVDEFGPYANLTREQAAKLFSNFAMNVLCRKPDLSLKISYGDTSNADPTLKSYITLAYQLGLMKGGNGEFRPLETITKAEFNAVLIRMILKSYLDESGSTWYSSYNGVATDLGIIKQGAGLQAITRHNAALMLFRAYKEQQFSLQTIDYESFVLEKRGEFVK